MEQGNFDPSMICNFDETMLELNDNKRRVVIHESEKKGYTAQLKLNFHVTLGVTIFADGSHCTPLIILPSKNMPPSHDELALDEFADYSWSGQNSGWITKEIFEGYMKNIVIPSFVERRAKLKEGKSRKGLIILDGHSSRNNPDLMEKFMENDIVCLTIPSHTSHILQPLDNMVFATFKQSMGRGRWNWKRKPSIPEVRTQLLDRMV